MCLNSESNLEMADEQGFRQTCDCGWTGGLIGFMAVRHWVQAWEARDPAITEALSSQEKATAA
jgi:hypothetical protein